MGKTDVSAPSTSTMPGSVSRIDHAVCGASPAISNALSLLYELELDHGQQTNNNQQDH